jgi:hypothetical protein
MSEITTKDMECFAKVLIALGETIKRDPNIVLGLLKMAPKKQPSKNVPKQGTSNSEVKSLELFELAKTKTKEGLIQELEQREVKKLQQIIKDLKFPSKNGNAKELAEHIADQLKNRTEDVFKNQSLT